jgi:hypothetical protein
MTDLFPYELTTTEDEHRIGWVDKYMELEAKQRKRDNFKIKAINFFRNKNNKLKLKEAIPILDRNILTNV